MADLQIHGDTVTISLSVTERIESIHADVTIPRSAITSAHAVPDGMQEVHGLRMPGTGLPGVILVGTFREPSRTTFAVCHGQRPAVVLDLTGQPYDRVVVTVDNPADTLSALG